MLLYTLPMLGLLGQEIVCRLMDELGLRDGDSLALGDTEADGLNDGDMDELGDKLALGERLGL